jgi:hypothetical protein
MSSLQPYTLDTFLPNKAFTRPVSYTRLPRFQVLKNPRVTSRALPTRAPNSRRRLRRTKLGWYAPRAPKRVQEARSLLNPTAPTSNGVYGTGPTGSLTRAWPGAARAPGADAQRPPGLLWLHLHLHAVIQLDGYHSTSVDAAAAASTSAAAATAASAATSTAARVVLDVAAHYVASCSKSVLEFYSARDFPAPQTLNSPSPQLRGFSELRPT